MKVHLHSAFGLVLSVPFACPLAARAPEGTSPDVVARYGPVPDQLPDAEIRSRNWQATPGRFLFAHPLGVARFLVEDGSQITIERLPGQASTKMLQFQFLGSVMAAVLRQRNLLVLHGMAAVAPAGAIVIAGASGAGKSTLLCALIARGCAMLSDDLTALVKGVSNSFDVFPGVQRMHLPIDSAQRLAHDVSDFAPHPLRPSKSVVPASTLMAKTPAPLAALYLLKAHSGTTLVTERLEGLAKFLSLRANLYTPRLAEMAPGSFSQLAALASSVPVLAVQRPRGRWSVEELADTLLSLMSSRRPG